MMAIYLWMAFGMINLLPRMYHSYPDDWTHGAEIMMKDTVITLASMSSFESSNPIC